MIAPVHDEKAPSLGLPASTSFCEDRTMSKAGLFRLFARPMRPAKPTARRLNLEPLEGRWVPANVSSSPNQNFVDQVYRDVLHRPPPIRAAWPPGPTP
jgi:hypothetical protein